MTILYITIAVIIGTALLISISVIYNSVSEKRFTTTISSKKCPICGIVFGEESVKSIRNLAIRTSGGPIPTREITCQHCKRKYQLLADATIYCESDRQTYFSLKGTLHDPEASESPRPPQTAQKASETIQGLITNTGRYNKSNFLLSVGRTHGTLD